jgi:1,4-dihydroxy-2-naphthoyl-CoA hydrolase
MNLVTSAGHARAMTSDAPADAATRMIHDAMPLCATLGVRVISSRPDDVVLALDWAPELCTTLGMLHGGVLMALADSAGATAAMLNLPEGAAGTSTIESKTNFLRGVKGGVVTATASLLHRGRSTIVVETTLHNDDRLVAKVTQTQSVLRA